MSSDLLVPRFAGRAFFQIHAFEDGIRPHALFDVENRLLHLRSVCLGRAAALDLERLNLLDILNITKGKIHPGFEA